MLPVFAAFVLQAATASLVDLAARRVVKYLDTGPGPDGIAIMAPRE